jgi:lambda repressor-like predicted transcriptional regulator
MKKPFAKQIILGTMALTLVGGGGYLLKGQDVFAATTSATTDTAQAVTQKPDNHAYNMVGRVNDELIAFLKLEKPAFQAKIASGKTLAEIAAEQGISRDALKAELTKEVTAKLDQQKADFATNLDKTIDAIKPAGKGGDGLESDGRHGGKPGGPGGKNHGGARIDLTTVATALGYTTADELKAALTSGKSIADLATEKGVSLQTLIDLEVVQIVKNLDQQLADGKITQAEYDQQKADSTTNATNYVNDKHNSKDGPGKRGGKNRPAANRHAPATSNTPATPPTATPSA